MQDKLLLLISSDDPIEYREGCRLMQIATPEALCSLINQSVLKHRPALADAISYQVLDIHPDHPALLWLAANISAMCGRWVESAERLIKMVRILGKDAPVNAFVLLSRTQRCSGNLEQAKYALKVGLLAHPDSNELFQMLAGLTQSEDAEAEMQVGNEHAAAEAV